MQGLGRLWFSFQGRASRSDFWVRFVFLAIVTMIVAYLVDAATNASGLLVDLWQLVLLWPTFALGVKRFHDRDRSGRGFVFLELAQLALLLVAVAAAATIEQARLAGYQPPALYAVLMFAASIAMLALAIYLLVVVGFRKGTPGPNRFGPDPRSKPSVLDASP
jgi:uncharacterized membrane protein YhaH (DUF805 family)